MPFSFKPTINARTVYDINLNELKDLGVKLVIFDIDDTLIPRDVREPEPKVLEWLESVKKAGFQTCIMTNNNSHRAKAFPDEYSVHYSLKPTKINFRKVLAKYGVQPKETCMVGDKIYTDILGANRMGMYSVLVEKLKDVMA